MSKPAVPTELQGGNFVELESLLANQAERRIGRMNKARANKHGGNNGNARSRNQQSDRQ